MDREWNICSGRLLQLDQGHFTPCASVYSSVWWLAWWYEQEPLNRQSRVWSPVMCFGGCVTVGKLLSFVISVFLSAQWAVTPTSWSVMPATQELFRWRWGQGPGNCTFHSDGREVLLRFPIDVQECHRHKAEHQHHGTLLTWWSPVLTGSRVLRSIRWQLAPKIGFFLIIELPLSSNGTFKCWQF